jgi:hypothetical protein
MLNQNGGSDADLLPRAVKDDAQGDEPTWEKGTESLLRPFKPRVAGNSGGIGLHKNSWVKIVHHRSKSFRVVKDRLVGPTATAVFFFWQHGGTAWGGEPRSFPSSAKRGHAPEGRHPRWLGRVPQAPLTLVPYSNLDARSRPDAR